MQNIHDSFDLSVIPAVALARVSGGAATAGGNEWTDYRASIEKDLKPLLDSPKPEVRTAVCALIGINGAADLQKAAGRPGERAKVGAGRALEEACRINTRLPSNAIFE